jgi:hypothetical protein
MAGTRISGQVRNKLNSLLNSFQAKLTITISSKPVYDVGVKHAVGQRLPSIMRSFYKAIS